MFSILSMLIYITIETLYISIAVINYHDQAKIKTERFQRDASNTATAGTCDSTQVWQLEHTAESLHVKP